VYKRQGAGDLARAIAVRLREGHSAWFADNRPETGALRTSTLTLPVTPYNGTAELEFALWWDTETCCDRLTVETETDGSWTPLEMTLQARREVVESDGELSGYQGRRWHRATVTLPDETAHVRWRYETDSWWLGRGVYVDAVRIRTADGVLFNDNRPADHALWRADGFIRSSN
jgi:hypothetical protein